MRNPSVMPGSVEVLGTLLEVCRSCNRPIPGVTELLRVRADEEHVVAQIFNLRFADL